jgi:hypothetical protein
MTMADEKMDFNELSDEAKEALTPRGEYLHPEKLTEGNSLYRGAPTGPVPFEEDEKADPPEAKRKTGKSTA